MFCAGLAFARFDCFAWVLLGFLFSFPRIAVVSFTGLGDLFRVVGWVLYAFDPINYFACKLTAQWLLSDAIEDLQSVYSTLEQNWRDITVISIVSWHGFLGSYCAYSFLSTLNLNWFVQRIPKAFPMFPQIPEDLTWLPNANHPITHL